MKSGGFTLRKWTTNCKELQDQMNQTESSLILWVLGSQVPGSTVYTNLLFGYFKLDGRCPSRSLGCYAKKHKVHKVIYVQQYIIIFIVYRFGTFRRDSYFLPHFGLNSAHKANIFITTLWLPSQSL